jgi:hypothetical protein
MQDDIDWRLVLGDAHNDTTAAIMRNGTWSGATRWRVTAEWRRGTAIGAGHGVDNDIISHASINPSTASIARCVDLHFSDVLGDFGVSEMCIKIITVIRITAGGILVALGFIIGASLIAITV